MRPCVFLLLVLSALLCSVSSRQVAFVGASLPNQLQASQFLFTQSDPRPNVAKCYGLARRTRSSKVQIPVLYNSVSGQTAAVPDYLFSLDDRTIDKMESEGWEVRMKTIMVPETFYQRVPVCCPWYAACYHSKQRDLRMSMTMAGSRMGPCMNGGMLVSRGGTQVCVCPTGYSGARCQTPSTMMSSFPSGPVIPYKGMVPSAIDVLRQAVEQAQMWKEKMMTSKQPSVFLGGRPMTNRPLLSPNDHLITSMGKQWAQQTPADKAMRMKMAMIMNWYLKQRGQQMRNLPRDRLTPMIMAPVFKAKGLTSNPYSSSPSQPFVNPQMMSMINHLQGLNRVPAHLKPYGQPLLPVQAYTRASMGRNKGLNIPQARTPWGMDPWEGQRGDGRGQTLMGGPAMAVGRGQPLMGGPSVPIGRGQQMMGGPSMTAAGRDKLMALAFAQYVNNIQRRLAGVQANGRRGMVPSNMVPQINRRVPIREPPMTDTGSDYPQNPALMDSVNNDNNIPHLQTDMSRGTTQQPNHISDDEMISVELPVTDGSNQQVNQDNGPMSDQGMGQLTGAGPVTSQQMPMLGMNGHPMPQGVNSMNGQMLQGAPVGAAGAMPKMPSQEELQRMTECRVVLEPRISMCLNDAGHALTLEQFMNPEYINMARGVCKDSESVGQCVMRQDQACGEGSTVEMTRKMIGSVLQMMGMVCGQIMKIDQERDRHPSPVPSMPQPDNTPSLTTMPQGINIHEKTNMPMAESLPPTAAPTDKVRIDASGDSDASFKSSDKFTTSKIGGAVTDRTPSKSASKSDKGHHSMEQVTSESFIPGAPLWIVILVACFVLLISCLSLILIALVVRRRRAEKSKEIERKAEPLDPKMFAIGIPPPQYATASIKTQDELSLPPLDLAEETEKSSESFSGKEDSDGGEEEEGEEEEKTKPAVSDDDADDESDEKEEAADKKKKEKKDKK